MLRHRYFIYITGLLLTLGLAGCSFSLAEDILPPANYTEPTAELIQPAAEGTQFPLVPPDPAAGAEIYAEKCAPCHGATGMGDGPQAAQLPNPAAQLGNPELARLVRPVDWFRIVTQGNIERFMPGFASLNDRQRWDVVAYALTLSATPAELEEGKTLYEQVCAECHGVTGLGDGERAAELAVKPANWFDQERLAGISASDMVNVMAGGLEGHPEITSQMVEDQQYAVAAYVRQLSFSSPGKNVENASTTPDASAVEGTPAEVSRDTITISGKVTNASPGGSIPGGMTVTISAYNEMTPAFDVSGTVADDGTYEIKDVQFDPNYVYFAQVEANGLIFNSDILHGTDISGEKVDLPVEIYDTTTDQSGLRTDRLHIFLDFTNPGRVQVVNLFIITNLGDKVVGPSEVDGPVVQFELPEGAQNLQFQDGELGGRFIETENGFADRMSIVPGASQQQILFAYELPYDRKLNLDIKLPLVVDAAIVMAPPTGVKVKSDQLIDAGARDVQGTAYQMYQASSVLAAGSTLRISLSGKPGGETGSDANATNYLFIGIGGFGVVLAALGVWLYRMRSAPEPEVETAGEEISPMPETSEALIDAIVVLDDQHASGDLPEAAYQQRRAELKARLTEVLKKES